MCLASVRNLNLRIRYEHVPKGLWHLKLDVPNGWWHLSWNMEKGLYVWQIIWGRDTRDVAPQVETAVAPQLRCSEWTVGISIGMCWVKCSTMGLCQKGGGTSIAMYQEECDTSCDTKKGYHASIERCQKRCGISIRMVQRSVAPQLECAQWKKGLWHLDWDVPERAVSP
jgi:hypothetical protein